MACPCTRTWTRHHDFISLESGGGGVSMYEDLVLFLSLSTQTLWILQVRNDGQLVVLKQLGEFMRDDDMLRVRVQESREARFEEEDDNDDRRGDKVSPTRRRAGI